MLALTIGGDVYPSDIYQIGFSSMAIFLGCLINANIFGELSVIFLSLDKEIKEF